MSANFCTVQGQGITANSIIAIVIGTCAGAFVSGIAGFAFALVALSLWAWMIEPRLLPPLAVFGSVIAQLTSLGVMRRSMEWRRVLPFLIGGAVGVPIGVYLLTYINVRMFRGTVGLILVGYCSFMLLARQQRPVTFGGKPADGFVGIIGGVMGGLAGLTGPAPTLWCTLRGWKKETQRHIFQTFNLVMQAIALAMFWAQGLLTVRVAKMYALMLPLVVICTFSGIRLYRRINEQMFRRVVLSLLLLSGVVLLIAAVRRAG